MNNLEITALVIGSIVFLTLLEFTGDWFFTKDLKYFGVGCICYLAIGILWGILLVYREKLKINIAVLNAAWQIGSIIAISILSRYILKEALNTITSIGLLVCCIGIAVVGIGSSTIINHD